MRRRSTISRQISRSRDNSTSHSYNGPQSAIDPDAPPAYPGPPETTNVDGDSSTTSSIQQVWTTNPEDPPPPPPLMEEEEPPPSYEFAVDTMSNV